MDPRFRIMTVGRLTLGKSIIGFDVCDPTRLHTPSPEDANVILNLRVGRHESLLRMEADQLTHPLKAR